MGRMMASGEPFRLCLEAFPEPGRNLLKKRSGCRSYAATSVDDLVIPRVVLTKRVDSSPKSDR